eukprot:UN03478
MNNSCIFHTINSYINSKCSFTFYLSPCLFWMSFYWFSNNCTLS